MTIATNLAGRIRNTSLPKSHGLLPLFEAVSNSIHAIEDAETAMEDGRITVEIVRTPQRDLLRTTDPPSIGTASIVNFTVSDNGLGFTDRNMDSFLTLDSDYKAERGGRGVGRLLWLKAFARATVSSTYRHDNGELRQRDFTFQPQRGVVDGPNGQPPTDETGSTVCLEEFNPTYAAATPRTVDAIASRLVAHCLWYFIRRGSAPRILVRDATETRELHEVYDELMLSAATSETTPIKGHDFELIHVRLRRSSTLHHSLAFCAANRLVREENLTGKIPGLFARVRDDIGDFIYQCYVASPFLDEHVRPERTGFDIDENPLAILGGRDLSLSEIRTAVSDRAQHFLADYLDENRRLARERVEAFVRDTAPRYRPLLARMPTEELVVDPAISDKELELSLHRHYADFERDLVQEGQEVMAPTEHEDYASYRERLDEYLNKIEDLKKSDLANYVAHRKTIIDLLAMAVQRDSRGSYAREDLVHSLIMPMKRDAEEVSLDRCNFWLIDERLAFHSYLASDKPLSAAPLPDVSGLKRPDLLALNLADNPLLTSESLSPPLSSVVVVEIKRPMKKGTDSDEPIGQALRYLDLVRSGKALTATGRPIPPCNHIPGFCYILCDLTEDVVRNCRVVYDALPTEDRLGYFFYQLQNQAYVEVLSFERLLAGARQRNRAFFEKLGLPAAGPAGHRPG